MSAEPVSIDSKRAVTDAELRRRAEQMAQWLFVSPLQVEGDPQRLLHELQVHQVELELQNAELKYFRDESDLALTELRQRVSTCMRDADLAWAAADLDKRELVAGMRDEIAMSVAVITEMVQWLRHTGVNPEQEQRLVEIEGANRSLTTITKLMTEKAGSASGS